MHKLPTSTKDSNSWALGSIILDSNVARAFIEEIPLWGVQAAKAQRKLHRLWRDCAISAQYRDLMITDEPLQRMLRSSGRWFNNNNTIRVSNSFDSDQAHTGLGGNRKRQFYRRTEIKNR